MKQLNTPVLRCKTPFIRITLAFIAGLLMGHYYPKPTPLFTCALLGFSGLYMLLVVVLDTSRHTLLITLVGLIALFLAGYLRIIEQNPINDPYHLIHCATPLQAYEAVVIEQISAGQKCQYTTLALKRIKTKGRWHLANANIRIYWRKNPYFLPTYGDVLLIRASPKRVTPAKDSDTFNYQKFLANKHIYHHHFLLTSRVRIIGYEPANYLIRKSLLVRNALTKKLATHITNPAALGIVLALVLGNKQHLNPQLRTMYANVGVLHVLAVSGLHVGFLYLLILFLLALLGRFVPLGPSAQVLAMILLWGYAFVTGLSPSVMRAVSMFSLLIITRLLHRTYITSNVIALSAFILLCYKPLLMFEVGFQLSYVATLGIIYLYPLLYTCIYCKPCLQKLWQLTTLSLAAQIAVFPLTTYYFHSFPVYFLFANWITVPATTLILYLTFLVLITSFFPLISTAIGTVLSYLITLLNKYLALLQSLPYSELKPICISTVGVCLLYALLVNTYLALLYKKYRYTRLVAGFVSFMLGVWLNS